MHSYSKDFLKNEIVDMKNKTSHNFTIKSIFDSNIERMTLKEL